MRRAIGHIKERSKGSYSVKVSLGKDPATGKYRYKWLTVRGSRRDAEKKLADLTSQIEKGAYSLPTKKRTAEFLTAWLDDYGPNLSPRTLEGYRDIINGRIIPALGKYTLSGLKPEHIQHFYSEELIAGLSAQTVRHHAMLLHKSLDCAVEWGLIIRNPADAVKPPRAQRTEMKTWTENEVSQFLEAAKSTRYYELFYLALFSGLRRSELLALRWIDIDFLYSQIYVSRSLHVLAGGNMVIRQPKTAAGRRTIALSPSVVLLLKEYKEKQEADCLLLGKPLSEDDLVFNEIGRYLLPSTISHAWAKLVKHLGLRPIRLHDARHTHASLLLKQNVHPKVVSERLGHSSIQITLDTYSHVAPGLQEAAAKRFDDIIRIKHNEKAKPLSSN